MHRPSHTSDGTGAASQDLAHHFDRGEAQSQSMSMAAVSASDDIVGSQHRCQGHRDGLLALAGVGAALHQPGGEHRLDVLLGAADLDHPPQLADPIVEGLASAQCQFAHTVTVSLSHQGPMERLSSTSPFTWATTSSARGRNFSSSSGAKGTGTSGVVTRTIGATRSSKSSSATAAAMSAPQPPARGFSSTMTSRPVLETEAKTASRSHGWSVRRSMTSADQSADSAAARAVATVEPSPIKVTSLPSATSSAFPRGTMSASDGSMSSRSPYNARGSSTTTGSSSLIAERMSP